MSPTLVRCLLLACVPLAACDKPAKSEAATSTSSSAPAVTPASAPAKTFGAGVAAGEIVAIDRILAEPAAFKGKTVKVEGMVTDVCPKRGCWFDMAGGGPGKKLRFKVTDGEMVFPMDAKGMHAEAQGQVVVTELSVEDSKKNAEYQAKEYGTPYDPASITKPTVIVRLDGTGAVFRDKK